MTHMSEPCRACIRYLASHTLLAVLLVFPLADACAALTLTKDGPKTAREGDLVEYRLEVVNDGMTSVAGVGVLDTLPAELTFVQATPTPGGAYDSTTSVWSLPTLGTDAASKTAGLRLEVMVNQNLIANPTDVLTATNRAEVIAPVVQMPLEAQANTNIVCAFCIDWAILSVQLDSAYTSFPDPFELRLFLDVEVANNGPIASDATVSVMHFDISGGGYGAVALFPVLPVAVSLNAGEAQMLTFATNWLPVPDSAYTVSWEFGVNDVALLDPIMPNIAAGSWTGTVEGAGE
ncbi:MAG: DUF11 domain-containing protein [Gammaproteobacteria bacterium]